jgi:hypothetical protein
VNNYYEKALASTENSLTMLASPKTRWRLRIHAESVTVVDEKTKPVNHNRHLPDLMDQYASVWPSCCG